ncbi:MAG: AraC family transcriptional regulator [Rikenellaceae bacterium]
MGSYLIFGKVAECLASSVYARSRRMVGVGFVIFGLEYVVFSIFNIRINALLHAIALNLSALLVVGTLFAKAVSSLLGDTRYLGRKWIVGELIYSGIFLSSIWSVVLLRDDYWAYVVLVLGLIAFLCRVYYWVKTFFRLYKRIEIVADNSYSESIDATISWLPRSIPLIVGLCYISGFAAFAPLWGVVIYIIYAIFVFYYIFDGIIGMMLNDRVVAYLNDVGLSEEEQPETKFVVTDEPEGMELRPYLVEYIEHRLGEWVDEEGYLCSDITLKTLAAQMNTNRTYLSNYINTKYKCSFRDWITILRLSMAKRLFESNPDISITDMSYRVGFASPTSFSRAFARIEGVTPHRWRELNVFR